MRAANCFAVCSSELMQDWVLKEVDDTLRRAVWNLHNAFGLRSHPLGIE